MFEAQSDITLMYSRLSESFEVLRQESYQRNTPDELCAARPYVCECGDDFVKHYDLRMHKYRCGQGPFECSRCKKEFTRKDVLIKHQGPGGPCGPLVKRPIPPDAPSDEPPTKRVALRERELNVICVTNGPKSYFAYASRPEGMPVFDGVQVCNGEVFCRHAGCGETHRFPETSKLKRHYKTAHSIEFEKERRGAKKPEDQRRERDFLEALALAAHTYSQSDKATS